MRITSRNQVVEVASQPPSGKWQVESGKYQPTDCVPVRLSIKTSPLLRNKNTKKRQKNSKMVPTPVVKAGSAHVCPIPPLFRARGEKKKDFRG